MKVLTIVEMALNIGGGLEDAAEGLDKVVDLAGVGASNSVSNADTVDAQLVNGLVQVQQIDQIGPERVFRREADLKALGLDIVDDLGGILDNAVHILAVAELAEI